MSDFLLNGDLSQMANQRSFLSRHGFVMGQTDVYPTVKDSDKKMALTMFWANKVEGWWNYHEDFIRNGICTQDQYRSALKIQCENR